MLLNLLWNLLRNKDIATGLNRCKFYAIFFAQSKLSFGQDVTKSSKVEVEILVSLMTSLEAGKVATVVDSMFTAK